MAEAAEYVSVTDAGGPLLDQDMYQRLRGAQEMNIHPVVMTEIVRQRQQNLLDDAKRWSRAAKVKRQAHPLRPED